MKICLECRRLVVDPFVCAPEHRAVAPSDPALAQAVWRDAPVVRTRPAKVGAAVRASGRVSVLGIFATVIACAPFSMCTDHPLDTLAGPAFWAFAALIAAIVVPALIVEQFWQHKVKLRDLAAWISRPPRRRPLGAVPVAPAERAGARGRAEGTPALRSPLAGRSCLAWSAEVSCDGQVMLRDGRAGELAVALEDGTTVALAAGPVEVAGRDREGDPTSWLHTLLPGRAAGEADPFPWDRAIERVVMPGDLVDVEGELRTELAEGGAEAGYRDAPATVLRPVGRVVLRHR